MRVYCGTERVRSHVLSGTRVLSGFERAEGPASVGLVALPVLKWPKRARLKQGIGPVHFLCTVQQLQHGLSSPRESPC